MKQYETVIGLEVHVELATATKIFCGCTTAFGGAPNTHCCPVCTGMPGTLPVLNEKVVTFAIAAGLATNCDITRYHKFDRKNYFYPDLPKAYQVSQLYLPICQNGYLEIETAGNAKKKICIREIHMEEDAGKLIHDPETAATLVDYNRCGVPLLEIVTQPDFKTAEEVQAFLEQLKNILQQIGVSDCKMQEGSLRVDVNLSVRPTAQKELGIRTEMKNLNSFKAIARAIAWEGKRQIAVLEAGDKVVQETRRWDDAKGVGYAMRSKEEACDYRYFPEPDLPPVEISEEWIAQIQAGLPELPEAKKQRYMEAYGLSGYDAGFLTSMLALANLFEQVTAVCQSPKDAVNWIMGEWMQMLNNAGVLPEETAIDPVAFGNMIRMVNQGVINRNAGKQLLQAIWQEGADPETYVKKNGLAMISDKGEIAKVVQEVLQSNPNTVTEYLSGKEKALGFLMGQAMRGLKGKANPEVVNAILKEKLKEGII